MTPRKTKKSTNHQVEVRSQKPFFPAATDRVFFATEKSQSTPFFTAEKQATPVVQRMPAFDSEVNSNNAALVQRQADMGSELPDKQPMPQQAPQKEKLIQTKADIQADMGSELPDKQPMPQQAPQKEKPIQTKAGGNQVGEVIPSQQPQPNSASLPANLKASIEKQSGFSMDDVRVHYNSPKPPQLQALAYTQGTEIHIAPGQEQYLPHEAWHVVQQMQGRVKPTLQAKGVPINDDAGLEKEADVMGAKAFESKQDQTAKVI